MSIVIICSRFRDIITCQNCKYLKNEKSFQHEIKNIFIIFKGFSVVTNCFRHKNGPLVKWPQVTQALEKPGNENRVGFSNQI